MAQRLGNSNLSRQCDRCGRAFPTLWVLSTGIVVCSKRQCRPPLAKEAL